MKNRFELLSGSHKTPWTLKIYDALPGNPLSTWILLTLSLLLVYFFGKTLAGSANPDSPEDVRVAVIHILLTTYSASAYAFLLMTARKTTRDLYPVAMHRNQWESVIARAAKYPRGFLPMVGAIGYLVFGVGTTNLTTTDSVSPWDWSNWSYDVTWQRITTVFFVWWLACLCQVLLAESRRLSRLSDALEPPDILDLLPYQPLIRQGLVNVLLVIGAVSIMSLFMVESRYGPALIGFWIMFAIFAWLGMMLPLRGIRKKIRETKAAELEWCRHNLKAARDELRSGAGERRSMAEIIVYKSAVENIRNWPFDNSTLIRFTLYIMIPLGSWLGGALVERGLDFFLS